jgi:hypothetical protein
LMGDFSNGRRVGSGHRGWKLEPAVRRVMTSCGPAFVRSRGGAGPLAGSAAGIHCCEVLLPGSARFMHCIAFVILFGCCDGGDWMGAP